MTNKDLLKKYVSTGRSLPEYQIAKLPNNLKNTYIRRRFISYEESGKLHDYEYNLLPNNLKLNYLNIKVEKGRGVLSYQEYLDTPDDLKIKYFDKITTNNWNLSQDISDNSKYEYISELGKIKNIMQIRGGLSSEELKDLPEILKLAYIRITLKKGGYFINLDYKLLSNNLKLEYLKLSNKINDSIDPDLYKITPENVLLEYLKFLNDSGRTIKPELYKITPENVLKDFLNYVKSKTQ